MKKIITLFLFLFFILTGSKAQTYFPEGAKWYYHNGDWQSASFNFTTIESMGDSIFNNDTLTYLEGGVNCSAGTNVLVKQIGKKIYRLNSCDSTYSLLYDFGANAGDTITIFPEICFINDPVVIRIDSISNININGNNLKYFYASQLNSLSSSWWFSQNIIEGIGNIHSFYPLLGFCDPNGGPLRCYEDSVIGYYNSGLYANCDTSFTVGINENELKYGLTISPNPSINNIKINAHEDISKIELFDIKGSLLLTTKNPFINIEDVKQGIYFVKVHFDDNIITRKILKE